MKRSLLPLLRNIRLAVFDFDGVFTDNRVIVSDDGRESVVCCRSDGYGLRRLASVGVRPLILSAEPNRVVLLRARKLQVECLHGIGDKRTELSRWARRARIDMADIAYVGNDINDAECLQAVGLPVVVHDAWPEVRPLAKWVLARDGGAGAVREFADEVWQARSSDHG